MTERDDASSSSTQGELDRDVDTRFAYRNLGWPWLLALLVVPLVLAGALTGIRADKIEDNLQARSVAALGPGGLSGVAVSFDGRDATLSPVGAGSHTDLAAAAAVVRQVDGVGDVLTDSEADSSGTAWLFGQFWILLFLSFLVGAVLTWLVARLTLPFEDDLEAQTGLTSEGLL